MRQLNISWSGIASSSQEHCIVRMGDAGAEIEIESTVVGLFEGTPYRVRYLLKCNSNWETLFCRVQLQHQRGALIEVLESDGKGNWKRNGNPADEFQGCMDVDLPVTPFTNTLPVRRLGLDINQKQIIDVVYLDILSAGISRVKQLYHRRASRIYHYENVPNDFEAEITVDDDGIVVDYPSLFRRGE